MAWRNTTERYGIVAASFHWLVAALVIGVLALGLYMTGLEPGAGMFRLYALHKSLGVTVLALAGLRLAWKIAGIRPHHLPSHAAWERILARLAHGLLYACLFAMPLSGWIMSAAKGFPVSVFGLFTLPDITGGENRALSQFALTVHETTAWLLIGLIGLHGAGALKHHLIDRDDTLRRMLPFARLTRAVLAMATAALLAAPAAAGTAAAQDGAPPRAQQAIPLPAWTIIPEKSRLTFEGTQMGATFTGRFGRFDGTILFDSARLAESRADITIPMADIRTGSGERDSYIHLPEWLDTKAFPESKFTVNSFTHEGGNRYVAEGDLTLRGVTLPLTLPFTLDIESGADSTEQAVMKGRATLKRLAYGIGAGEWKDPKAVGDIVTVHVDLVATHKK